MLHKSNSPPTLQTSNSPPTLQTPNSPPPIAAVPLAVASTPTTGPLDKGKRVLTISSEDEDSDVGPAYKRRRSNRIVYSRSPSPPHGGYLMNNPPSATSPSAQTVQEEGVVESAPLPTPTPTPAAPTPTPEPLEIPSPIRQLMRGFTDKLSPGSCSGENRREGMPYYLGAFLAIALEWRAQAKSKADEARAIQAFQQEVATLKEEKESLSRGWARQEEAYKTSLKLAQEAKEETAKQLHAAGQAHAELLSQAGSLHAKIADLEAAVTASEAQKKELEDQLKRLEDQCIDREKSLGKTEGELAAKMEALNLLQSEHSKFQAEATKLQVEKEFLEKQLVTQASKIGELVKSNQELINDMAGTFDEGFKEALAQATCENPGIDTSNCNPCNHIIDGKVVPLDLGD